MEEARGAVDPGKKGAGRRLRIYVAPRKRRLEPRCAEHTQPSPALAGRLVVARRFNGGKADTNRTSPLQGDD